jgi:phosphatidylglycerol---prolipoprotein diacylglyceryl transferase
MALLLWLSRRFKGWLHPGDVFLIYLVVYPVGRILLEFLRMDASQVAGMNINQVIMAVVALISTLVFLTRHWLLPIYKTRKMISGE